MWHHKLVKSKKNVNMEKRKNKKLTCALLMMLFFTGVLGLTGCGKKTDALEKIKDLEFTVIAEENIPEELLSTMEGKKETGFKLTFQDNGFLYICRGYGKQETGGYSISVDALYETENAVYFDTTLTGPQPGQNDDKKQSASYPYVVIKTEAFDKPVVFE